ncbi:MAG TPA: peptidoglycan DD-metalloendopeptidase family protein [Thermoleophilaceae bacterium]|jgi:hypothetical protein
MRRLAVLACALAAAAAPLATTPAPAHARGTPGTAALQVALRALHHYGGAIDGIRGPRTRRATRRFQRAHHLHADGVAGPRTRRALGRRGRPSLGRRVMRRGHAGWDVAGLQWLLRRRGFAPGSVDGGFGGGTLAAVLRAQRRYGLLVDGLAGATTIRALKRNRGARRRRTGRPGAAPVGPVRFLRPVRARAGDGFGPRGSGMHTGIDFPAPSGAAVGAGGRGTVVFAGWNSGGYGNLVVVRHRLGFESWYAHLSSIAVGRGASVVGGTRIGYVGSTGRTTGPHLHFEVRRNGVPIDPAPYLLGIYAAKTAPPAPSHATDGCAPPGGAERDPRRARLVPCGR